MNKTFGILAHTVSESLIFSVNYFSSFSENEVLIHVDEKVDISSFLFLIKDNVKLIKKREKVLWGHISLVKATLNMMREYNGKGVFFLLSGDDFPVMSNDRINKKITDVECCNLIHFQDRRNRFVDPIQRTKFNYPLFFFKKNKSNLEKIIIKLMLLSQLSRNKKGMHYLENAGIKLVKGSQWFTFNSNTVQKIINFVDENPEYFRVFERSFCPDEMFFHTLINHLGCERFTDPAIVNDSMRYLDWTSGPDYPKSLDSADFKKIRQSGCMFARKASKSLKCSDFEKIICE